MSSGDDASLNRTFEGPTFHDFLAPPDLFDGVPSSSYFFSIPEINHYFDPPTNHEVVVISDDEDDAKIVTTAQKTSLDKADGERVEVMPKNNHNVGPENEDYIVAYDSNDIDVREPAQ